MHRHLLIAVVIMIAFGWIAVIGRVDAQDGSQATIAALQTRVSDLEATVDARGEKISAQRTRIAELKKKASQSAQPTQVPAPEFLSGGLGQSREQWEQTHGSGTDNGLISYEDNKFLILFGNEGNVFGITWNLPQPVGIEDARAIAQTKLPDDWVFVSNGIDDNGNPRDYFFSESLATRFSSDSPFWGTTGPGSCFISYELEPDGFIRSVLIATGDK